MGYPWLVSNLRKKRQVCFACDEDFAAESCSYNRSTPETMSEFDLL